MKKNGFGNKEAYATARMKHILPLLGMAAMVFLAGCAVSNQQNGEEAALNAEKIVLSEKDMAMIEHCKMMPNMRGCDDYRELEQKASGSMMPSNQGKGMMDDIRMDSQYTASPGEDVLLSSLSPAKSTTILTLDDGDTVELTAEIVSKMINGKSYKMYGYNGQIPGPVFKVKQGSTITVIFKNTIEWNTTVHWHGLRHNIKDDGVPWISQEPVQEGESFTYTTYFPDDGIFWYHPHIREDFQQDSGLAGNMLVVPSQAYNPVNREELLVLDDILIEDGDIVPYGSDHANFAIMGRFGNTLLVNGGTDYALDAMKGDVVRFYLTNVANVRPFNITFVGGKMKLVGSDLGQYEQEEYVDSILIAPAERYIVDVFYEQEGNYAILHTTPKRTYTLGSVRVSPSQTDASYARSFDAMRENREVISDVDHFREYFSKPVDYQLNLTIGLPMGMMKDMMKMDGDQEREKIEWEDTMQMMNSHSDTSNIKWILKDGLTGKENMGIGMKAKVGDKLKISLFNDPNPMHPMQHPIHLHGQRFLVLSVDGVPTKNFAWKDTVLVPLGSTVDILVDVTNPGEWMAHCHIAEHLEAGMMTALSVT